jgi:hypothetical protein
VNPRRREVVLAGHRGDVGVARAALSDLDADVRELALGACARLDVSPTTTSRAQFTTDHRQFAGARRSWRQPAPPSISWSSSTTPTRPWSSRLRGPAASGAQSAITCSVG